jgi:hypothetical protein
MAIGLLHCGQLAAAVDTSLPQSEHLIKAIFNLLLSVA